MKIVVISKKPVLTAELGRLPHNMPIDVSPALGKQLLESGVAVLYETKVQQDRPSVAAGSMEPSPALPVAPASQVATSNLSDAGVKRRGRPRKEASSS